MRFLIIKNVPGLKELRNKIHSCIYHFTQIYTDNPHSGIILENNRYDNYLHIYRDLDGTFAVKLEENDSEMFKDYKRNTNDLLDIVSKVCFQILEMTDDHMEKTLDEMKVNKKDYLPLKIEAQNRQFTFVRSLMED
jgi:hypothetical protein